MFDVKKFARLARLKLTPKESEKISKDLLEILNHFKELEKIDTKKVEPMTGGTSLSNIFREDKEAKSRDVGGETDQFPETEGGYLKSPRVFQ